MRQRNTQVIPQPLTVGKNQVQAQRDFFRYWKETMACKNDVYPCSFHVLPKELEEKVVSFRLLASWTTLTVLTPQSHCV